MVTPVSIIDITFDPLKLDVWKKSRLNHIIFIIETTNFQKALHKHLDRHVQKLPVKVQIADLMERNSTKLWTNLNYDV